MEIKIKKNTLIKKINKYDYVSFDIFDTLIKRDCSSSSYVFKILENRLIERGYSCANFYKERIEAERVSRSKGKAEVTLDDIYNALEDIYSKAHCEIFKEIEIDTEISLCHPNKEILEIYQYCVKENKHIILISDMYLPRKTIQNILHSAGIYNYDELFLSCELMKTKHSGELFDYVLAKLNLKPNDLVHIGDNFKSDYLRPKLKGIAAINIRKENYSNLFFDYNRFLQPVDVDAYKTLCAFINNHCDRSADLYFQIGYETLGPMIYGFTNWLHTECIENKYNKIFFLSRDGQILQKAYNFIIKNKISNNYMYASRRALIVPSLWMCKDLEEVVGCLFFPRFGTIESFIKKTGINPEKYKNIVTKYGYSMDKYYVYNDIFKEDNFKFLFDELKEEIYANSKAEYYSYIQYLKEIGFEGKVAIVDIGWHGNMQRSLQKICQVANINAEICGYYIGLNPNYPDIHQVINAKGYLFSSKNNEYCFELERNFNSIFEIFLTADHGSVKCVKYEEGNKVVYKVPFEYLNTDGEFDDDFHRIKRIQSGALSFINDILLKEKYCLNWSPLIAFQNLALMGNLPSLLIASHLGDLKVMDDEIICNAKPANLAYYLIHPFRLYSDLCRAPWRIGFIKRLFRINLPYFDMYMLLRRVYLCIRKK